MIIDIQNDNSHIKYNGHNNSKTALTGSCAAHLQ